MANRLLSRQSLWFFCIAVVLATLAIMGVAMVQSNVLAGAGWVEYDTAELIQQNMHPMQLFIK